MTITAVATDTVPITQVTIYVDGVLDYNGIGRAVSPFSLNTKKLQSWHAYYIR